MAKDLTDTLGHAVGRLARETAQSVTSNARKAGKSPISGPKGLAAGAGLVALAPLAAKGAGRLVKHQLADGENPLKKAKDAVSVNPVEKAKEAVTSNLKDAVGSKIDEAGGPSGIAKEGAKSLIPGMGGDDDDDGDGGNKKKKAGAQIGHTRRMPVQQAIDVAVPIEVAYNQWTQFEEWPNFMHRLDNVSQEDETHVKFKAKFWGISREFTAEIVEQRPDERIKWEVTEGVQHTGVVTFHKLADRLTRVDVDVDIQPGSLLEKAGRGMRHAKRAIRADLSRFKAYIELEEEETGEWRGEIEDGDVKPRRSASSGSSSGSRSSSDSGSRSSGSGSGSRSRSSGSGSRSSGSRSSGSGSRASGSRSSGSRSSGSGSGSRSRSSGSGSSGSRSSGSGSGSRSRSSGSRSSGSGSGSGSRSSGGASRSRSAAASSGGSSRAAGSRSSGSSKSSGGSSSGSSKSSGRSTSARSSGSSSGRSSSGSSNGSTRSSRAKSSNGASASRSTKRKTASRS